MSKAMRYTVGVIGLPKDENRDHRMTSRDSKPLTTF